MAVSLQVMMPVFSLWLHHHYHYQHPTIVSVQLRSFTQSCLTLRSHGLQHARLPCPSPAPRAYSNSCPSSEWWHPTISASVVPFSSHLQSVPAWGSFQMSQFLASGGQSIGVLASTSVLPMNIQNWFSLGCTGLISLQSKGLSSVFSSTTVQKHQLNYCLSTFNEDPYLTMQCSSFCCHIALIISKLWRWKNKKLQICNTRGSSICIFLYF